jgi:hypothetical protein
VKLLVRLLVCSGFLAPGVAGATTWTVGPGRPLTSIQAAIDLAQAGDRVDVEAGWYHERLTLKNGVSVHGLPPGAVVVDAEGEGPVVTALGIGTSTTISGLVLHHGSALHGGGLYALASSPTFQDCIFTSNTAVLGGGAYLRDGSRAVFVECQFVGNLATVGGGLYVDFSAVRLDACRLSGNEASDGGGLAASNAAEASLNYTLIHDNRSRAGNTIACNLASPSFTNCTVVSNLDPLGTFGLRGSGTRIERSIIAFNAGAAVVCAGFSTPWVGCNLIYGNGGDVPCAGDQGTNLGVDPLFCDPLTNNFQLSANSPAAASACGALGAQPVACPAQGVDSPVEPASWTRLKTVYR